MSREALLSHSMNLPMKLSNHSLSIEIVPTNFSSSVLESDTNWCSDSQLFSIGRVISANEASNSSARQEGSCPIPVCDQIEPPWYLLTIHLL